MSKAKSIVEAVAFEALAAAISGATVYQDAPANAAGDLVIIGDLKSASLGGKGADADLRFAPADGAGMEVRRPYALVSSVDTRNGWKVGIGQNYEITFDVREAF